MRLKNELVLEQVWLGKITTEPHAEDTKLTVPLRAALTQDVAEAFGCRELIYAGNVPRSGVDEFSLEGDEIDCTIHIQHDNLAFAVVANSMGGYVAKMEGTGPLLCFKLKVTGFAVTFADLADKAKVDPFQVTLKPSQMDLGLKDAPADSEDSDADGGPEVDESQRLISPEQAADTMAEEGPTLVPATFMGGTHQRGTRKNRGRRNPEQEAVADGTAPIIDGETEEVPAAVPDFMSELEEV